MFLVENTKLIQDGYPIAHGEKNVYTVFKFLYELHRCAFGHGFSYMKKETKCQKLCHLPKKDKVVSTTMDDKLFR